MVLIISQPAWVLLGCMHLRACVLHICMDEDYNICACVTTMGKKKKKSRRRKLKSISYEQKNPPPHLWKKTKHERISIYQHKRTGQWWGGQQYKVFWRQNLFSYTLIEDHLGQSSAEMYSRCLNWQDAGTTTQLDMQVCTKYTVFAVALLWFNSICMVPL